MFWFWVPTVHTVCYGQISVSDSALILQKVRPTAYKPDGATTETPHPASCTKVSVSATVVDTKTNAEQVYGLDCTTPAGGLNYVFFVGHERELCVDRERPTSAAAHEMDHDGPASKIQRRLA